MAILYAFDGHKNKVAFNGDIAIIIPMQLPDGSILFYDRGSQYGEYHIDDAGYPVRNDGAVDDGNATSNNWRYLICDSSNLTPDRDWSSTDINEGLTEDITIGYGLPNTETMLSKYKDNTTYLWNLIQVRRDATSGKKWFLPSKDELNIVYQNKSAIVNTGGGGFPTDKAYWSSSERSNTFAWTQDFSDGDQSGRTKNLAYRSRLLRRI